MSSCVQACLALSNFVLQCRLAGPHVVPSAIVQQKDWAASAVVAAVWIADCKLLGLSLHRWLHTSS